MQHEHGLWFGCLDGDETHGRAGDGFAYGLCVGRIILAAFDIGFDILRWHQAHVMAEAFKFSRLVMGTAAGFHAHKAGR